VIPEGGKVCFRPVDQLRVNRDNGRMVLLFFIFHSKWNREKFQVNEAINAALESSYF
jgi:hypothetical protein